MEATDLRHILFVDDEPDVLQGIRRMLRPMRKEWRMEFIDSGSRALEHVAANRCDVIVTDMRMPGMDGLELLSRIREQSPHIVRIVLSGQADRETIMRAAEPTHQYLAKPCDADRLKATVARVCALKDLLRDESLQSLVAQVSQLPSLPSIYSEVSEALADGDVPVERIGEIISQDVAMTAKILKLVNSAFFGVPRQVDDAAQATTILGLEMVKALVLSVGVFRQFEGADESGSPIADFEIHSQRVGALARHRVQGINRSASDRQRVSCRIHARYRQADSV